MGMKQILVMMMAAVLVGCGKKAEPLPAPHTPEDKPSTAQTVKAGAQTTPEPLPTPDQAPAEEKLIADPIVEKAIREELDKPKGELTEEDLTEVTTLDLGFTKITDEGLKDVAKLQKLKWLWLNDTNITDAGLKDVAKLQQLKILILSGTKATDAGLAEIEKALPDCRVTGP